MKWLRGSIHHHNMVHYYVLQDVTDIKINRVDKYIVQYIHVSTSSNKKGRLADLFNLKG